MLLPWLVVLGAMVVIKANRDRRVWLILLPLGVVGLMPLLLKSATVRSSNDLDFDLTFQTLICGLTLLWLAAPVLGRHGALRLVAAWSCGWVYRPGPFILWLLLWCVVIDGVATLAGGLAIFLTSWAAGVRLPDFRGAVGAMVGMGLLFGLFVYALNVPYLLLGFASPFFRTRLQTCLNLRGREAELRAAAVAEER